MELKFVADVHLGKLARWLRILGFDTVYQNNSTSDELHKIALEQTRIFLSRTVSLSSSTTKHFIVTGEDLFVQVNQVVQHFNLKDEFHPFSRCIVCNGPIENVPKENIIHLIQKNTAMYFDEFWQCLDCKRVYWKGSHFERMKTTIERIITARG